MNKKYFSLPFILLVSCSATPSLSSPSESDVFSSRSTSESIQGHDTFETVKELLCSQTSDDTVADINERAISMGLYKPMFELSHFNLTHVVYPYAIKRQQYYVLDVSKLLVLDKPITSADHDSLSAQNFTSRASAVRFLEGLGYTPKNEATLSYAPFYDDAPITEDFYAKMFLSRKLFITDETGALQDDAASLSQNSPKEFTLELKDGISWRDVSGNPVRQFNADDVLNGYVKTLDHGLFQDVRRASDTTIVFTTKEPLSTDEVKWAIAVSYGSPKPSSDESFFLADEFSGCALEDGYQFIKNGFTLDLRRKSEITEFDLVDATAEMASTCFVKDRINYGLKTYGFRLNPTQGNDAYREAVNNEHFRKALLALLGHDDIRTLTHNSYISRGYYDNVPDTYSSTWRTGHDLPPVVLLEGVDEARSQFALALEEGLPKETIELYVGDVSYRNQKVTLLQSLAQEAFGDRVRIVPKVYSDEQYYFDSPPDGYPYVKGSRTFYCEIELDGYLFPSASAYVRAALSAEGRKGN